MAVKLFKSPKEATISLKDMLEIASDNRFRVSRTPFGAKEGEELLYAGRAVAWKGKKLKASEFESEEDFVKEATKAGIPEKVARNIYRLAKESHDLKGKVHGYVLVRYGGEEKVMPAVAFLKMVKKLKASGEKGKAILASMDVKVYGAKKLPSVSIEDYEETKIDNILSNPGIENKKVVNAIKAIA